MGYNPYSLEKKTILITGASSGIGAETAVECSRLGATVVLAGRKEERLQAVLSRLDISFSQSHRYLVADLTSEEEIATLVEQLGPVDGLVNNAGTNRIKPLGFIKPEDLDYVFQNNRTIQPIEIHSHVVVIIKLNRGRERRPSNIISIFSSQVILALY